MNTMERERSLIMCEDSDWSDEYIKTSLEELSSLLLKIANEYNGNREEFDGI